MEKQVGNLSRIQLGRINAKNKREERRKRRSENLAKARAAVIQRQRCKVKSELSEPIPTAGFSSQVKEEAILVDSKKRRSSQLSSLESNTLNGDGHPPQSSSQFALFGQKCSNFAATRTKRRNFLQSANSNLPTSSTNPPSSSDGVKESATAAAAGTGNTSGSNMNEDIRVMLLSAYKKGNSVTKAVEEVRAKYGERVISYARARHWFLRFRNGIFESNRGSHAIDMRRLDELLDKHPDLSASKLAAMMGLSRRIIAKHINNRMMTGGLRHRKYSKLKWFMNKKREAEQNRLQGQDEPSASFDNFNGENSSTGECNSLATDFPPLNVDDLGRKSPEPAEPSFSAQLLKARRIMPSIVRSRRLVPLPSASMPSEAPAIPNFQFYPNTADVDEEIIEPAARVVQRMELQEENLFLRDENRRLHYRVMSLEQQLRQKMTAIMRLREALDSLQPTQTCNEFSRQTNKTAASSAGNRLPSVQETQTTSTQASPMVVDIREGTPISLHDLATKVKTEPPTADSPQNAAKEPKVEVVEEVEEIHSKPAQRSTRTTRMLSQKYIFRD